MSKKKIEGITKIAVSGFKSLVSECAIEIRPLTILAGTNSSGKSSIMQPLLMLKQTLEATYDPGPLLIEGPNVQFTEAEQFLSTLSHGKGTDRFQIGIDVEELDLSYSVKTTFGKSQNQIDLIEMTVNQSIPPEQFTIYPEMSIEEVKSIVPPPSLSEDADIVRRSGCFLRLESQHGFFVFNVVDGLAAHVLSTIYLPGSCGNPERAYKRSSTGPQYSGTFEHYFASIIHEWQETKDERLKTVVDALQTLGLAGIIDSQKIGDVGIEIKVGRLPHDSNSETDMVSIADVGFGVSQVLPIVVALTAAEQGQLVYIEQPELHLHPRTHVNLAQVLADAAKRGVRVVAETHSSLLLLAVQTLVAEGSLSPEVVKLHWFTRGENGATKINTADLDDAGAYGDWPEDFDDVDLKAQSRYLDAVNRIAFGNEGVS